MLQIRHAVLALVMTGAVMGLPAAQAQSSWPDRPIRLVVPFGPGSVTDQLARTIATGLSPALGQTVVVENKAGAGGNIGAGQVAHSAPDGYTLLMGAASTNAVNPSLYKNLNFDPMADLVPVANVAAVTNVLVVNPEVPARSVTELIALLKREDYTYASGGAGGSQHLAAELFKSMSGTDMLHVPYKGGSEPLPDLMSNRVQVMFCNLPICLPHIQSGKLVALGVTSMQRATQLPDVPTISESGLPGYEVDGWFGLFAPANVPQDIIRRLNEQVQDVLKNPETNASIQRVGAEPKLGSQEGFAEFVRSEHDKWKKVIADAGIRIE